LSGGGDSFASRSPDGAKRNPGTPLPHSASLHAGYEGHLLLEKVRLEETLGGKKAG
jgi:hypothetical protein